MVSSKRLKQVF